MNILEKAISKYGVSSQLDVAIEEFSELTKEICKFKRGKFCREDLIEEVADCYIMLRQIKIIFDISEADISMIQKNKIHRLSCLLEKD